MAAFPFVPGVEVEIQDGGLRGDAPAASEVVTLLGYTDAAGLDLLTPIRLQRKEDRFNFLNADGSVNELVKKITEAIDGGAQNLQVVVLGTSQPVPTGVYSDLSTAYDLLLNAEDLDIIVPAIEGVYIDATGLPSTQNFAYQLADFCYRATVDQNSAHGVIGVSSPAVAAAPTGIPTLAELEAWVAALETYDTSGINGADFTIYDGVTAGATDKVPTNYAFWATDDQTIPVGSPPSSDSNVIKDARGNPVDIGAYISVAASWRRVINDVAEDVEPTLGYYRSNMAAAYAGMITRLRPQSAPTNKPLGGGLIERELSKSQQNRLAKQRFVVLGRRGTGAAVVSAMTGAYNIEEPFRRSDFTRLSTVRIVHAAVDIIRSAALPFIGEANNAVNRNALQTKIDKALSTMQEDGALEDYTLGVRTNPADRLLGVIRVDVNLRAALEIRDVQAVVSVS